MTLRPDDRLGEDVASRYLAPAFARKANGWYVKQLRYEDGRGHAP